MPWPFESIFGGWGSNPGATDPVSSTVFVTIPGVVGQFAEAKISEVKKYANAGFREIAEVVGDGVSTIGNLPGDIKQAAQDLFEGNNLLIGIAVAAGTCFVYGPFMFVPALIAGAATSSLLIKQRHMTQEERWFVESVFGDTLPPNDQIILTNLSGIHGRAFVYVNPIGQIIVNLGDGFGDPVRFTKDKYPVPGQVFIHEMTHVWQAHHSTLKPGFVCQGIWEQTRHSVLGEDIYDPRTGERPWDEYTNEQQATLIDRWYMHGCLDLDPANPYDYGHALHVNHGKVPPRTEAQKRDMTNKKWASLGFESSFLGRPTSSELSCPDGVGRFMHFQGGSIYWHPQLGAFEVHGDIRAKWESLGWERSFLGYPTTDESSCPDGVGRFNHFQGGSIFWHPQIGAFEVHGEIRSKWAQLGWERSFLGYPTTDETSCPDGVGRFNHFQGGSIYWHPQIGAFEVHGDIRAKWAGMGWERSVLGYPTTNEVVCQDGAGRYTYFQGGAIYWHPQIGVFAIRNPILAKWASIGAERSIIGYPTTDEDGGCNHFQRGSIYWNSLLGTFLLHKPIRDEYLRLAGPKGWLGFPTDDTTNLTDSVGLVSDFEHGYITWTPESGVRSQYVPEKPLTPEEIKENRRESNPHIRRGRRDE